MPTFIKHIILLFLFIAEVAVCHSQSRDSIAAVALPDRYGALKVSAHLDVDSMTVGDQQVLHLEVAGVGKSNVVFPVVDEMRLGTFEALESRLDTASNGDITQHITITSFVAGRNAVENIVVGVQSGEELILLAPADSLMVTVAYVAEADTVKCEAKPDAPNVKEPYTFWEIIRWVLLALLVAAVVFAVVWIIKQRKANNPISILPKPKPIPPDQRALRDLESLRRKELWQKGRVKKYYTDMTDIVRNFLRNMYGINASEMTTRQTLRAFHACSDWSDEGESLLRQLLQRADMVKFAKSQPEEYEHNQSMQDAVSFVRKVAETHQANNPIQ